MLIVLLAVNLIHILDGGYHPTIVDMWGTGRVSFFGTLSEVAPPAAVLSWIWFSIGATGFGRQIGSRLWQAIGIVYLIGMALIAAAMVSMASGDNLLPIDLVTYAAPVLLVGWACHGVGLIVGARKMART